MPRALWPQMTALRYLFPYKYLHLFEEPRLVQVTYDGHADGDKASFYPISKHDSTLVKIGSDNFFIVKVHIDSDGKKVQKGQMLDARLVVNDKTLWQQVFKSH